jgi:hypothetical protein
MFEGHTAYVKTMLSCLKRVALGHQDNLLKEDITGMIMIRLLDYRSPQLEGENEEAEQRQQAYRIEQTKIFNVWL